MSEINETAHAVAAVVARSKRVRANIERARQTLRIYLPGDDVELAFRRAVCHPLLGGILRKDETHDVPGPSFTVNSLRRAAERGELRTSWHGANQFTCPAALREWVANRQGERPAQRSSVVTYRPPAARTNYEKQKGAASIANASAKLTSLHDKLKKKGK